MTSFVSHVKGSVMTRVCVAANKSGSLVFSDYMSTDRSSRMKSAVYRATFSTQGQSNAAKLIRQHFVVQILYITTQNIPKNFLRQINGMFSVSKSSNLTFHLLMTKRKTQRPTNKSVIKGGCNENLKNYPKKGNTASGDVHKFPPLGNK